MDKTWSIIAIAIGVILFSGGLGSGDFSFNLYGIIAALLGWRLYQNSQKKLKTSKQMQIPEQKFELNDDLIIRLAKRLGGKLTVEQLTSQTSLTATQAQERLEKLHAQGICNIDLNEVDTIGKVIYHFE